MKLVLRPFAPEDDGALISWVGSAAELERFAGPSLRWPLDRAQLEQVRATRDISAYTAFAGEERVGHIELVRAGARQGRIARVLLDPARRGEGLGRPLLDAALAEARRAGLEQLDLSVFADNERALRVYRAVGFVEAGPDPLDPRQLRMRLTLSGR